MATTKATNLGHRTDVTLKGTTTTIETDVVVSDTTTINNAGDDVGLKINSTSTGNIMQLQDNGTDVMVVADGGKVGIGTSSINSRLTLSDGDKIFVPTGEVLNFGHTDGSTNTERMRIDSAGNVGIGLTDPSTPLQVQLADNEFVTTKEAVANKTSGFKILSAGSTDQAIFSSNSATGEVRFGAINTNYFPTFYSNNTERMRIITGGQIRIKCANMNANPGSSNSGVMIGDTNTGSLFFGGGTGTESHMLFGNTNGVIGSIQTSGSSTSFNETSDYRLKENVTPLTGAIDRLNQLKPSRFNFIADPETTLDGFLAHEVSGHVPEAVTGQKDAMTTEEFVETEAVFDEEGNEITPAIMGTREVIDPQGIDKSKLVPLIVASIQELSAKVTALENATN